GNHRKEIISVDPHAWDSVRLSLLSEGLRSRLVLSGNANRPTIVAAEEDSGNTEHSRHIHTTVKFRSARRAVSKINECGQILAIDRGSPSEPHRLSDLGPHRGADGDELLFSARVVVRHLPTLHRIERISEHVVHE